MSTPSTGVSRTRKKGVVAQSLLPTEEIIQRDLFNMLSMRAITCESGEYSVTTIIDDENGKSVSVTLKVANPSESGQSDLDHSLFTFIVDRLIKNTTPRGKVPESITFNATEFLNLSHFPHTGYYYQMIYDTLDNLRSVKLTLTVDDGAGTSSTDMFQWVERINIRKETDRGGVSTKWITVRPTAWLRTVIKEGGSPSLMDNRYFQIRSTIMKRIYEVISTYSETDTFKIPLLDMATLMGKRQSKPAVLKKSLWRNVQSSLDEGNSPIPGYAMYLYDDRSPEQSATWSARIPFAKQYLVFVKGGEQLPVLEEDLNQIPSWKTGLQIREVRRVTSITA